jgi:hypothetical protein
MTDHPVLDLVTTYVLMFISMFTSTRTAQRRRWQAASRSGGAY